VLPGIRDQTGASEAGLGAALLVMAVGALPAMLAAGVAVDRLRPPVGLALLLFAAAVVLPGFAGSVPMLALSLVVVGAASGALDVIANAAVASLEAESGRRLMQAAHALFSLGVVAGSVTAGLARQAGASPKQALVVAAAAVALTAVANRGRPQRRTVGERRAAIIFSRTLVILGALCAVAFVVESGVESWSALYLEDELESSAAVGGLGPGSFAAAMALGRLFGQGIGGRTGDRTLLAGGVALAGVGTLIAAAAPGAPTALAGFAVAGAGIAVAAPVFFGTAGRVASPEERGGSVATVTTISYLGFLAGPALMGAIAGGIGFRAAWVTLTCVAASLAIAVLVLALPLRARGE
jgi:predicted MFS family arabinose efflux permease